MLTRRPITLADAIMAALEVEVIDKEHERMEKRIEEPIPSFIPIIHQPSEATRPSDVKKQYLTSTCTVPILQPIPLATREPPSSAAKYGSTTTRNQASHRRIQRGNGADDEIPDRLSLQLGNYPELKVTSLL